jgi:hypothetical protein
VDSPLKRHSSPILEGFCLRQIGNQIRAYLPFPSAFVSSQVVVDHLVAVLYEAFDDIADGVVKHASYFSHLINAHLDLAEICKRPEI